jgi:hypothetical protein
VWHDPEGRPPPEDVIIPRIEGAYSSEWTDWTWDCILVEGANCREVIDNVVDMAHFFYIHFAFPTYFKNVFEGHIASQYLRTRSRPDVGPEMGRASNYSGGTETTLRSEASYFGPAYMIDNLWHDYHGMTMESVLINCHYPVTPTSFLLQWGAIVKRPPGLSAAQASRVAAKFADFVGLGFGQDVEIWMNKTRIDNPLLCAEDGPVYQVRRWYEQFYCDVADIAPDMVARYEFEIDTTRAVAGWEAEVAANLARAAGGLGPPPEAARPAGSSPPVRVPSELCGSVARCYSLSSSPLAGERPAITVKRAEGGYASNWIAEHVAAGTVLDLLPPAGTFCPGSLEGDFLLFAAGSGITPVMSILADGYVLACQAVSLTPEASITY